MAGKHKKLEVVQVWYLQEWFAATGMVQYDLVTKLDYNNATAFKLWHGLQPARADHIRDISALLNIEPFELLMHPDEAMRMRRMRQTISEIAKEDPVERPVPAPRTGTRG